jgi:HD-like signal output (HDOD) protein
MASSRLTFDLQSRTLMYDWFHRIFKSAQENTAIVLAPAVAEIETPSAPPAAVPAAVSGTSWMQRDEVNAHFNNYLFGANDNTEIFASQIESEILAALEKIVRSSQSGANLVRRMPGVIPQLLQSLRTEEFSGTDLAHKISHDVVLVAAVLRLANSASYHVSKSITSIEHAILILGHDGMRQLITGVAFKPIIDLKSGHFAKLAAPIIWDQSRKCAVANRLLAHNERVDPFEAFLAGLMQNVGLIASLRVMDQMSVDGRQIGSVSFFNSLIGHARILSCSIGREWHFPEAVITAIGEQGSIYNNADMSPIGKILSIGDYLSKMHLLHHHQRLDIHDARVTQGLSAKEMHCLKELDALDDGE